MDARNEWSSKSRFKSFATRTQWIFVISSTIFAEREVASITTQEEFFKEISSNPVPENEAEADNSQGSVPMKATEALQYAHLQQQVWMQQDIVDHEMLAATQTAMDKISVMWTSKLIQKPILEYFSQVWLPK
uniref:Uncharacterized protein n=1 Tax=Hyaloperonospora arabidopsidis (strain Emoy2) TaxID=559515 RepID=M4B5N3_HYAAE